MNQPPAARLPDAPNSAPLTGAQHAWVAAWILAVALLGGVASGWLMTKMLMFGNLGTLFLGILAGAGGRQITGRPVKWFGWALAGAVLVAFFVANCFWLRYANFAVGQNSETWLAAARRFFTLYEEATHHFFVGLLCTAMGAFSAYWRAGTRGRALFVDPDR